MALAPHSRARMQATAAAAGATWVYWRTGRSTSALGLLAVMATLAAVAWIAPRFYAPVQHVFDALIRGVLRVISWSALALVYLLVFTPLRVARVLTKRDRLQLRWQPDAPSYLTPVAPLTPGRFERQF